MITIETLRDQISNMERAGKGNSLLCKKLKASLAKLQGEKKRAGKATRSAVVVE